MAEVDVSCTMATMNEALLTVTLYETPWVPEMGTNEINDEPVGRWREYITFADPWLAAMLGGKLDKDFSAYNVLLTSPEFRHLPVVPHAEVTLLLLNPQCDIGELVSVVTHDLRSEQIMVLRGAEATIVRPLPAGTRWSIWVAGE